MAFDNRTSLKVLNYSPILFSNIGCKEVIDLTAQLGEKIKKVMNNIVDHVTKGADLVKYEGIELNKYNQILCLYLNNPGKNSVLSALERVIKMDGVMCASPDYRLELAQIPDDNLLSYQSEAFNVIDLYNAWNISTGSENVRVGVIDSGVDATHIDLIDNLNVELSRDFTLAQPTNGAHIDELGHGTHVAGIIGAQGDNGTAGSGVCWDVDLVSLKAVIPKVENGIITGDESWTSWVVSAVYYASLYNFDILNMSLCWLLLVDDGEGNIIENPLYNSVMYTAISNFDGLVVCAAGNHYQDNDLIAVYPANYDLPNLITVGATDTEDIKPSWSNYGQTTVDLFAPGVSIWSTKPGNRFVVDTGTSMATPFVTGVAALMLSVNPNLTPVEIKHMIVEGVDNVASLANKCVSGGRLNALNALEYARDHSRNIVSNSTTSHTCFCSDCGFFGELEHDLFMYSDVGNEYVIKCKVCNYSFVCYEEPEYSIVDTRVHSVNCPGGCYSFFEEHSWAVYGASYYRCSDCGAIKLIS